MAERDMTGEDLPDRLGPADDLAGPDPTPGPVRRRAEETPRIGRLGFEGFGAGLAGLAGGAGDLANLPPWSIRDDGAGDRLDRDRDPVALAAWRRVAERRRLRAGRDLAEPAAAEIAADVPDADIQDADIEDAVGDADGDHVVDRVARTEVPVDERPAAEDRPGQAPADPAPPEDELVDEVRPDEVPSEDTAARDHEVRVATPSMSWGRPEVDPPGRGPGPSAARGGRDTRPGTPPPARPDTGGRHEVLLSLAGRIDDDALSSVRELVAVEDDAAAAELLGGCLLAAGAGVTAREHAVLGRWFAASRVDPELVDVLPRDPEADRREEHRFTPDPPPTARGAGSSRDAGEAVARAAARLPGVQRVRQCWRTTPAGSAPGPVPHRVVLVETRSADDCEHVAHHVAHAARELGAVSVEVFAAGAELPAYHRAAVRVARPLGAPAQAPPRAAAETSAQPAPTAPPVPPVAPLPPSGLDRRPGPLPPRRRADDEVPPFGVPVSTPPVGPSFLPLTGPDPDPNPEPSDERGVVAPTDVASSPPGDEQYRTVAAAGPDPLERAERAPGADESTSVPPGGPAGSAAGSTEGSTAGSMGGSAPAPAAPEPVAPEAPAPVDLDTESTAERIAALWRTPPPDEILSDEHPISSWAAGMPLGVSFGPGPDGPQDVDVPPRRDEPRPGAEPPVDPDAATGEFPAVRGPDADAPATNGVHEVDLPGSHGEARVRRARHSRSETGEFEAPVVDAPGPPPAVRPGPDASGPPVTPSPVPRTNGHHHGPERPGAPHDAVTGPVHRPVDPPGGTPASTPAPPTPAPTPAPVVSGPDSVDSQLSDRERELLARLHEELASRERLEADAPDPLTGRPVGPPPGSEDATAPRPRPTGPHPGRPPGPPGPPPGPTNGHRPVNGHGLPGRRDHDDGDGTSPGA